MKFIYKITLLLILFPLITSATIDEKKHEKKKTIKKEYTVNTDAKVSINNKYGNLNITTWDKNRVEIEVIITVKGDDLESVEDKLDAIVSAYTLYHCEHFAYKIYGNIFKGKYLDSGTLEGYISSNLKISKI